MARADGELKVAYQVDPTLIVKVRVPLDPRSCIYLAASAAEHPEHQLEIVDGWLEMRKTDG